MKLLILREKLERCGVFVASVHVFSCIVAGVISALGGNLGYTGDRSLLKVTCAVTFTLNISFAALFSQFGQRHLI